METYAANGGSFNAHLSLPKTGKGMGLLVFHGWWGLNPFIIQTCDMLAQKGFAALAPDYYDGRVVNTIEEAKAAKNEMDRNAAKKLVSLAADFLAGHRMVEDPPFGAIGFSLGASLALEAARRRNKLVGAVVLFYGTGGGKFDKTNAAFMGHFAENDNWGVHTQKVAALEGRIKAAGQKTDFFTYPKTDHWFMETQQPEYNPAAAAQSWERTIAFLRDQLG